MKSKNIIIGAIALILAACTGNKGWEVSGTIAGAADSVKVAIQGVNPAGSWYTLDSVAINADGHFSYRATEASPYPDIYRLSFQGQTIYFPVEGSESVTINGEASDLTGTYTIAGNPYAEQMRDIDMTIRQRVAAIGAERALTDSVLKGELNGRVLNDTVGLVAYYIINKSIGGMPLYSAGNSRDVAMLGAVAQRYKMSRPDDPRAKALEQEFVHAKRSLGSANGPVIELEGAGYIDLELYDERGDLQRLGDMVKANPVVLLSFTSYELESSLAYNHELYKLTESMPNVAIYQVSVQDNELQWRETALNLPWTTVKTDDASHNNIVLEYNVQFVPLTYVIVNGNIVERVIDPTTLSDVIKSHQ